MNSFSIIPVLDLKRGKVVRARAGDRANYQPIVTPLSATSEAAHVLRGLQGLARFSVIYIADLDAIAREVGHGDLLHRLAAAAPDVEFWLDGGFATANAASADLPSGMTPVFGSESLIGPSELMAAKSTFGSANVVLSLDYRDGRFMGPREIEHRVDLWPDRMILMTLDRVGTAGGPDFNALDGLVKRSRGRAVFAAGGVRGEDDLARLRAMGVRGVLVATALHDGRLSAATLTRFQC